MNTNHTNKTLTEQTIANLCAQSFIKLLAGIEQTKGRIAAEFREIVESNQKSFQLALNEAEALAWQTEFPQLFFPDLVVEKVQVVATWKTRQQSVHQPQLAFARAA
jgi:hypothetical protein